MKKNKARENKARENKARENKKCKASLNHSDCPTDRFPLPSDIPPVPGTDGWDSFYPYCLLFNKERPDENEKFWFLDSMHWPDPVYPFDAIIVEASRLLLPKLEHVV
ncbi:MAG: hypothetical protein HQK53_09425 [Oligoflexia bacterium]|nr:hypothetical protein [Oligoflexia bacterium]